ncbi:hypothetical protein K501DRAFT_278707 [Backusella circina FSU 941]|nr:hypothetical protein K501DRAFT_278707 [Backusella circina FSU 941]
MTNVTATCSVITDLVGMAEMEMIIRRSSTKKTGTSPALTTMVTSTVRTMNMNPIGEMGTMTVTDIHKKLIIHLVFLIWNLFITMTNLYLIYVDSEGDYGGDGHGGGDRDDDDDDDLGRYGSDDGEDIGGEGDGRVYGGEGHGCSCSNQNHDNDDGEDRHDWLLTTNGKDQYINYLDSKVQKLEFNNKQAIVLLAEKDGLYKGDATIQLCLNYLRNNEPNTERRITPDIEEEEEELMEGLDSFSFDLDSVRQDGSYHTFSTCTSISLNHMSVYNQESIYPQQQHLQKPPIYRQEPSCINCKQLLNQLDDQLEQRAYLKRDLNLLASALKESKKSSTCLESKTKKMCREIQVINSALFTVLNEIYISQVTNREHLRHQDKFVLDLWDARDTPLAELKQLLVQLHSFTDEEDGAVHGQLTQQECSTFEGDIDQYAFCEFQEHLKSINSNHDNTAFWKKIVNEEIKPCLFNNNNNNNNSKNRSGWRQKRDWSKHKSLLLDAIIKNQCDITPNTNYTDNTRCCASCHSVRTCEFRLSLPGHDGYIDQWCRNKLVAVIDLYQFMSQLKERRKVTSELDLFKQVLDFRQRIAQTKIASI